MTAESCSSGCNDDCSCTVDSCRAEECAHTIGPNTGATACDAGSYCAVEKCCVANPPCPNDEFCEEEWRDDACKANPRCDLASKLCIFDQLDGDGDGHAPPVCGGDDCDDSDAMIAPGAFDDCDGNDNDCDGQVDEDAACGAMRECRDGACECLPEFQCGAACIDTTCDSMNCGACNHACGELEICLDSECRCADTSPDGTSCPDAHYDIPDTIARPTTCSDSCVDTFNDPANCGDCNVVCGAEATCFASKCRVFTVDCDYPSEVCDGVCIDATSDAQHCGACDVACDAGFACVGGECDCPHPLTRCGSSCVNLEEDLENCGACGVVCEAPPHAQASCWGTDFGCNWNCPLERQDCNDDPDDGCEVDLNTDEHCGGCDVECPAGEVCIDLRTGCGPP